VNWIYIATLIGGVLVVVSVISAITRGGDGWARRLLVMALVGCLLAGALMFTRFRPAGPLLPRFAPMAPSMHVAVAPPSVGTIQTTTHIIKSSPNMRGRGRAMAGRHAGPHDDAPSSDSRVFETTAGEGVVIAKSFSKGVTQDRAPKSHMAGMAVVALAVIAMLYVGYLFLDAGTRGQFTWLLRFTSVVAFAVICIVVAMARQWM